MQSIILLEIEDKMLIFLSRFFVFKWHTSVHSLGLSQFEALT